MRIFYYKRPDRQPNFGDELNRWLWPKLRPDLFGENSKQDEATVFIGTGTLLNSKLAERVRPAKNLVIFGTGAGYEQTVSPIPDTWKIVCVRGPLSARRLGIEAKKAITDSGLLVAQLFTATATEVREGCSFMPHIHSASAASDRWQSICRQANVRYIDPRWAIEKVLREIGSSELLLAEAMHGAIAADALRVPWLPVVSSPRIYGFKWQDWCGSVDLEYRPHRLPALAEYPRWGRGIRSGSVAVRHWAGAALESPVSTVLYELSGSEARAESMIAQRLTQISKASPCLSTEDTFKQRLDSLQTCLHEIG